MNKSLLPEFLSCQQVRAVDRFAIEKLGMEGLVLMENAARGCVDLLESKSVSGGVTVVCGKGNNGGDGMAMVRHLLVRGYAAKALLVADPNELQGDARTNFEILKRMDQKCFEQINLGPGQFAEQLSRIGRVDVEWIVDALLGTGTQGQIKEPISEWIEGINRSGKRVLAVDIPSGLDGDTGFSLGPTIKAECTGTFVCQKSGFQNPEAQMFLGEVEILDIGVPASTVLATIS